MYSGLLFKSKTFCDDGKESTIEGENFKALMDLCFSYADTFSLHRCNWPGAHDGALEMALRPYLLGEYFSYATLLSFDRDRREKCYLYPAIQETKEILLLHIRHLFDSEKSLAPANHEEYLRQKYAAYTRAAETASNRWSVYLSNGGLKCPEKEREAYKKVVYREAEDLWRKVFREEDYYSNMEDPCFFRGSELFLEVITHEQECSARVLSSEFEDRLLKLGEWVGVSDERLLPQLSLDTVKGWKRYEKPDAQ